MNNIKSIIAQNITDLRRAKGLTQLELAEQLNYSDKAVSKWERAESMPDVSVVVEIADLFDVPLDISAEYPYCWYGLSLYWFMCSSVFSQKTRTLSGCHLSTPSRSPRLYGWCLTVSGSTRA